METKLQIFEWSDRFATGVALIDQQHQQLLALINTLGDAIMCGDHAAGERVRDELQAYARFHFADEEAWARRMGVPAEPLARHAALHAGFAEQIGQFKDLWEEDGRHARSLHRFVAGWLITHVLGGDRRMVREISRLPGAQLQPPDVLTDGEVVLIKAMSNMHEALIAANNELDQRVQQRTLALQQANERLRSNFLSTVRTFTSMMELRGGMLAGHSRRTADLARRIAQQLELDAVTLQNVFLAGLLHDIGKLGLPDDLLGKPVVHMNAEELTEYRKHPETGQRALIAIDELQPVADGIRSHHERFDGKGYPDKLSGVRIPLLARILAVANDFDGLQHGIIASRRRSVDEALKVLRDESGQRYDPVVVNALLKILGRSDDKPETERKLRPDDLQPGMVLSRDLLTPDGMLLLAADQTLHPGLIRRIQTFVHGELACELPVFVRQERT